MMGVSQKEIIVSCVYFLCLYALMVWMLFLAKTFLAGLPQWMVLVYLLFVSLGLTGFYFGTEKYVKKWIVKRK
jgi:protein-S-isoprenylcysteine O-methyltransferase Ste14